MHVLWTTPAEVNRVVVLHCLQSDRFLTDPKSSGKYRGTEIVMKVLGALN